MELLRMNKRRIMIALSESKRGGPYISHKRIMESDLKEKFQFIPWYTPRIRKILSPNYIFKFRKFAKKNKPDVIHISGLQLEGFLLVLICRIVFGRKFPILLAIRGSSKEAAHINKIYKNLIQIAEIITIKLATISYAVSKYV